MLEGMGIATGVDMPKLVAATNEISRLIGAVTGEPGRGRSKREASGAVIAPQLHFLQDRNRQRATSYLPPSGPITRSGR